MQTIVITGGTGLIGKTLGRALLQKGYRVMILTRDPHQAGNDPAFQYAGWDVAKQQIDREAISAADGIVHLAGAGVADRRWTPKRKQEILSSRVESSRLLVSALQQIPNRVKTVISASAIGWYGEDPEVPNPHPFAETAPPDPGFLGSTCEAWEKSIDPAGTGQTRLVKLRIGIVLSREGGAFRELKKPLYAGVAAITGNGKQFISWIHISDLVQMFIHAIETSSMKGVYNAVAPNPVTNKALILAMARSRQKFFIPVKVPAFMLKLLLGEMSIEILKSTTVSAGKIIAEGFRFEYPELDAAMAALK